MSTYTQILYQIIFSTKNREPSLAKENRTELHRYIWGIIENKQCRPYMINGIEDHVHILTHLHPSVPLASLVKDIKVASSLYIKEKKMFPDFKGWQSGYGAFTYSQDRKQALINYILNQEAHHQKQDFRSEYRAVLDEQKIEIDERFFL